MAEARVTAAAETQVEDGGETGPPIKEAMTTEEERQKIIQLTSKMAKHVAMAAFVTPGPASPHSVVNNGTFSLLELPKGKFLVTNHHVWDTFVARRSESEGWRLGLIGEGLQQPVDVSTCDLVDADAGIDLAVLRFPRNDIIESVGKAFYQPKRFPLDTAVAGDDAALVGFPGNRRSPTDKCLNSEAVLLGLKVDDVSDRKLMLSFHTANPTIERFSPEPLTEFRWGGMSGSMLYRVDPALNQFFVAGFLQAAGDGLSASFFAARADLLKEDGTIRR